MSYELTNSIMVTVSFTSSLAILHQKLSKEIHLVLILTMLSSKFSKILVCLSFQIIHKTTAGIVFQMDQGDLFRLGLSFVG